MICRTFPRILSLKRMPPIIEVGSTLHLFTQRVHFLFNITFVRCRADRKFILTSIVCVLTGGCSKRPDCQSVDWPSGWGHRWQRWREGRQRASHRIEPWCYLTGRETCNRLCQLEAVLKTSAVWVWPIRSGILEHTCMDSICNENDTRLSTVALPDWGFSSPTLIQVKVLWKKLDNCQVCTLKVVSILCWWRKKWLEPLYGSLAAVALGPHFISKFKQGSQRRTVWASLMH